MSPLRLGAIVVVIEAAISAVVLYLLYFRRSVARQKEFSEQLAELNLPASAAERRRRMQTEEDDETLEKIKLAARLRIVRSEPSFSELLYQHAQISTDTERGAVQRKAIVCALLGGCGGMAIGLSVGNLSTSIGAIGVGLVAGGLVPFFELKARARTIEHQFAVSLRGLIDPLRITLDRGLDITTTLKEVLRNSGIQAHSDPVLQAFERALDETQNGMTISAALREVSRSVGVPRFAEVCRILALIDERGSGWKLWLEQLRAAVDDDFDLTEQQGYKLSSANFDKKKFYPKKRR